MYQIKERIRYSEVGSDRRVNISQIVNYFQDCSTFHSEDLGVGLDYLESQKKAWLLSSWQIIVERYPKFGEKITVGTWAYEKKGLRAYRNFNILDESGAEIAKANSIWFLWGLEQNCPLKILEEDVEVYGQEEKLEMEYAKGKIKIPSEGVKKDPFSITKMMIDTNSHVNNEKYIELAMEYLPEGFKIYQMRAEYKKPGMLQDIFYPIVSESEKTVTVQFQTEEGEKYAVIEFQRNEKKKLF